MIRDICKDETFLAQKAEPATPEDLPAAAGTGGVENPARKTSAVSLRLSLLDFLGMLAGLVLLVLSFVVQ